MGHHLMLLAAALCIALAALGNPLVLTAVVGRAGVLPLPFEIMVWAFDAALIAAAVALVRFRTNAGARANLALVLATVTVSLLLVEGALRILDYRPAALALYAEGPPGSGAFRLKPNLNLATTFEGRAISIRTNSHGMRWPEVSADSRRNAPRVAFVGDSFTFGQWADTVERSFVGVVGALMQPLGVEVLNFGVPGYGLIDAELLIRDQVLRFRPEYVVLAFYNGNDFLDTYLGAGRYRVSRGGVLDTDWQYVESRIPLEFRKGQQPGWELALGKVYLYGVFRRAAKALTPEAAETANAPPPHRSLFDRSYTSDIFWSRVSYPDFANDAKAVSLRALDRINELCKRNGARFMVVAIPSREQVYVPSAFTEGYDPQLPQRHVEEFARDRGVPYLDLLPPLRRQADQGVYDLYWRRDGHLRNEGHRVIGERIAAFLGQHISQRRPPSPTQPRRAP